MDVYAIRLQRIRELVAQRFEGNKGKFADAIGRKRPYVYRLFSATSTDRRAVGEVLARDIERRLDLPAGFLDREDAGAAAPAAQQITSAELELLAMWRKLFDHQRDELTVTIARKYEEAIKVEAELKRRGFDRFVPDDVVAIHIKPSPPQQELLVTPPAASKPKRPGKGRS